MRQENGKIREKRLVFAARLCYHDPIDGKGHTISGMIIHTAIRGPMAGHESAHGDGQSCYYYSAFVGRSTGTLTIKNLTFDEAIVDAHNEASINNQGSSSLAIVLGMNSGSLTCEKVHVKNSTVSGYTKLGAFTGNDSGTLSLTDCSVEGCQFLTWNLLLQTEA